MRGVSGRAENSVGAGQKIQPAVPDANILNWMCDQSLDTADDANRILFDT